MKNMFALIVACLSVVCAVEAQKKQQSKPGKESVSEEQAIKDVIAKETDAFFSVDYEKWMACWMHSPSAYWSYADSTGTNYFEGWEAIEIGFTDYFVTSKPSNFSIDRTWQEVRVYDKGAYARFKQRIHQNGAKGPEQVEIRLLEKDDQGKWKILLVGVLKSSS